MYCFISIAAILVINNKSLGGVLIPFELLLYLCDLVFLWFRLIFLLLFLIHSIRSRYDLGAVECQSEAMRLGVRYMSAGKPCLTAELWGW